MEIESSLIVSQNQLASTPVGREPERQAQTQEQQNQRRDTQLPRQQVVVRQNKPEAFAQAERFKEQQQTDFSQTDFRNRRAIDAYQTLSNEQQRSEIQSLLGIDTYV